MCRVFHFGRKLLEQATELVLLTVLKCVFQIGSECVYQMIKRAGLHGLGKWISITINDINPTTLWRILSVHVEKQRNALLKFGLHRTRAYFF